MLSILLALVFAGVQGANALDSIQHSAIRAMPHEHIFLSALTMEEASVAQDRVSPDGNVDLAESDRDDGAPVTPHHHHNADHGSSLPAYATTAPVIVRASVRLAIPYARADIVSRAQAFERPPKPIPTAA